MTLSKIKTTFVAAAAIAASSVAALPALAADYVIDTKGAHASINFKIQHLGYSWLTGRFDTFSGNFSFDEKDPAASNVMVEIDTNSVNSNHAARDKHLRSADFLEVDKFPTASFKSTKVEVTGDKTAKIHGDLTLHGVTKSVVLDTKYVGGGKDPWGGFRQGFEATTQIALKDFGIKMDLGPASQTVDLSLHVEGVRK
ncbi:YceI family protein [Cohaesibacter gelatinilyticus]|uniref:Polyisoprenoid-binding protein YceI n=1 Tax=Cohaesibacter gelatinilyticus TaxID=372072 RepID=A0A285NEJ9_9HYPH|nr:YceI family protein [Cohaesibacter gelatinilyticus]SNZ07387.1 Polyisoprenoid-binding protein YceI [Cohaesibacter gelatinilyticus]